MAERPNIVLLDTDVWSHLYGLKGRTHPKSAMWRELLTGRTVAIATQTRAEVLAWPLHRNLGDRRTAELLQQLDDTPTIPVDEAIVQRYARLTADAKRRGDALWQKQHTADRWIAATALALGASLLANDGIYRNDPDLHLLDDEGDTNND